MPTISGGSWRWSSAASCRPPCWTAITPSGIAPALGVRVVGLPIIGKRIARFVSQTGIRYRASALSTEAHGAGRLPRHAPHAGDRAPDVELGYRHRVSDLLRGPQHTLLLFGGRSTALIERFSELAREVTARYGDLVKPV